MAAELQCFCLQALASATGKAPAKVKAEYDKEGDLGKVAASARATQKTMFKAAPLTVQGVFKCETLPANGLDLH